MLKKPMRRALKSIVSANGWIVATVHENEKAEQIVHELNAFDALLAACESVLASPGSGHLPNQVDKQLRSAISKAKPEPASRPDVTTEEVT